MRSPKPAEWTKPNEGQFFNHDWTEECQGVTHDDSYWYLSSNHKGKQRVYRFTLANNGDNEPGENTLRAYRFDSSSGHFVHVPSADIVLQEKLRRIQGAVFSKNGHVLLASNHTDDIRCYSVLNGYYLGRASIQKDGSWNVAEEVEGLTIWEGISYEGVSTHVHVVLLDNDKPDDDDVYFKHYRVPLAEHL
jgi:hypothetical protein